MKKKNKKAEKTGNDTNDIVICPIIEQHEQKEKEAKKNLRLINDDKYEKSREIIMMCIIDSETFLLFTTNKWVED